MFTLFVIKKDSNGVERCIRQGRAMHSKLKASHALKSVSKGVVLDIGSFNPAGINNLDTFLRYGCVPVDSKGMDTLDGAMLLRSLSG